MILIGGDFVPTGAYFRNLKAGRPIFGPQLTALAAEAEYIVVNLECSVTTTDKAITKCGPNLKAAPEALALSKQTGVGYYSLANNHIYDFGQDGLIETLEVLDRNKCGHWGAAATKDDLQPETILTNKGKRIGILSIAENEFSIATRDHGGAYGIDYLDNAERVAELRSRCDYVVVLYHGGVQHYRLPTPKQQKFLRHLLRVGADTILCQHSHILGATDRTQDGMILYGQGNFLFPAPENASEAHKEVWNRGSVLSIDVVEGEIVTRLLPIRQSGLGTVELEDLSTTEDALIANVNAIVADISRVAEEWESFVTSRQVDYWSRLYGWSRLRRVLSRKLKLPLGTAPNGRWAIIRNVVECESHREALETLWQLQERGGRP